MQKARLWGLGLLAMVALAGCAAPLDDEPEKIAVSGSEEPLVNGTDNRIEPGNTADWSLLDRSASSIGAVMPASRVNVPSPYPPPKNPPWGPVTFNAPTLKQAQNLCDGQRFADEQTPAKCTATLIDEDLVITDGHCVSAATCSDTRFVFSYWRWYEGDADLNTLYKVYKCQSVVVAQTSPSDYAIVRLDRSTKWDQAPAPIRRSREPLAQGLPLVAIGHLDGTSAKISPGGIVLSQDSAPAKTFLLSNDGSAVGSLGSGIFSQDTGELVGIWTDPSHGEPDYVPGPAGSTPAGCQVARSCPESGCGAGKSLATYVGVALDAYCATNTNPRLCAPRNTVSYSRSESALNIVDSVFLEPGATIDYGTCGIPGSSAAGDTTIGLRGPYYKDYGVNDDGANCGLASRASYTSPPLTGGRYGIRAGCYQNGTCSGTVAYTVSGPTGGSFSYTAQNTNSATQGTRDFTVSLRQGETLIAGTCGVENGNFTGDTLLVLKSGGAVVAANDDACGGKGSTLTYTSPTAQTLTLQAGCFGAASCSGTVAFTKGMSNFSFSTVNTNGGTQNTDNRTVHLAVGDKVTVGTCGLPGASYSGDTVASLYLGSTPVATNDNDCGGLGSRFLYRVTTAGDYSVRIGCALNSSCNGRAVVRVTPPNTGSGSQFYGFAANNPGDSGSATTVFSEVRLWLRAGDVLATGTCPTVVTGASGTGDTFLRLIGPQGPQVAVSDDDCPGNSNARLSSITNLLVTADKEGAYLLKNGCYANTACSGTTVYTTP